jgi:hypothetical protein
MRLPKRLLTKHRRARLIAWTLAVLAWLAWVFSAGGAPNRRHMRQRYGFISLDRLARNIALLIIVRAAEIGGVKRYRSNPFFSRLRGRHRWPRHVTRSIIGARQRRALRHSDVTTRVAILTGALHRLDAWAARLARPPRHDPAVAGAHHDPAGGGARRARGHACISRRQLLRLKVGARASGERAS